MPELYCDCHSMRLTAYDLQVLKIKPLRDDEVFDKLVSAVQYAIDTDGYHWSFWKTGGGWGEVLRRYKPYKKKEGECLSMC